jgi:hypothetical protein
MIHTSHQLQLIFNEDYGNNDEIFAGYQSEEEKKEIEIPNPNLQPLPYEKFYQNVANNLHGKPRIYLNSCKKLANNIKSLAYYLYKHSNMTERTQKNAVKYYNSFIKEMGEFTSDNLTTHYNTLDIGGKI